MVKEPWKKVRRHSLVNKSMARSGLKSETQIGDDQVLERSPVSGLFARFTTRRLTLIWRSLTYRDQMIIRLVAVACMKCNTKEKEKRCADYAFVNTEQTALV